MGRKKLVLKTEGEPVGNNNSTKYTHLELLTHTHTLSLSRFCVRLFVRVFRADVYGRTVPYTTRVPREGEVDGVHYNFVSRETFAQMQEHDEFVEVGEANGVLYGTPKPLPVAALLSRGVSVRGAAAPNESETDGQPTTTTTTSTSAAAGSGRPGFRRSRAHLASVKAASKPRALVIKHRGPFSTMGLELSQSDAGVFVLDVADKSPAAAAGLARAMQIMAVDGVDVTARDAAFVRERLNKIADEHEVVVKLNTRGFSSAAAVSFTHARMCVCVSVRARVYVSVCLCPGYIIWSLAVLRAVLLLQPRPLLFSEVVATPPLTHVICFPPPSRANRVLYLVCQRTMSTLLCLGATLRTAGA